MVHNNILMTSHKVISDLGEYLMLKHKVHIKTHCYKQFFNQNFVSPTLRGLKLVSSQVWKAKENMITFI